MCESCRLNYRKYGDENGKKIPEYLFRPVEPASRYRRPPADLDAADGKEDKGEVELDDESEIGRKSPGASSTSSNASNSNSKVRLVLYLLEMGALLIHFKICDGLPFLYFCDF